MRVSGPGSGLSWPMPQVGTARARKNNRPNCTPEKKKTKNM